jgi:hypothetical protein
MSATYAQASLKAQTLPGYNPNEGHADGVRDMWPIPARARRRCHCGCNTRQTHVGGNNAIALMGGCELSVRRWVRDGNT